MNETKTLKIKFSTINTFDAVKEFYEIVHKIEGDMDLGHGRHIIDAKSLMGIYALNLSEVLTLTIYSGNENEIEEKLKNFIVKE